ncbi:von Willebrand factor A domain-containing protein 5A-like isoform X2 [Dysidea avara]|uniref:von Willebrand factor A domain-containing protein 5A-like isoform X2 n=1 Tax=Dysidea avara TaxID=196820 RepID=UPI0033180A61
MAILSIMTSNFIIVDIVNLLHILEQVIHSLKKALQPSANNVTVTFDLPSNYEVKVVPDKIPSIYNGDKTVIYGLLMTKSDQTEDRVKCNAILTGDIVGNEFKFVIPFELPARQVEEDVTVIHQLAAKKMIQEWQDDGEPYENKHKQEIIALSCDASVVSKYTAYVAVDEIQNKPVSGSMQAYELTADRYQPVMMLQARTLRARKSQALYLLDNPLGDLQSSIRDLQSSTKSVTLPASPPTNQASACCGGTSSPQPLQHSNSSHSSRGVPPSIKPSAPAVVPPMQSDSSFIVSLQQSNGSWVLNDQLAGAMSKSVEKLMKCCPVSCDVTTVANIWATLVVIEFLKKKYSSMMEELELVIIEAEQWLGKQVLPPDVNLVVLKDSASKVV